MRILSIGEVLWDVFGDEEYLGGAPLNFSAISQRLGNTAALLTAVGNDERGTRTLKAIHDLNLTTEFVQRVAEYPTGIALVSTDQDKNAVFTIERPAAFDCVTVDESIIRHTLSFGPDWLYFGTLAQASPQMETSLMCLMASFPETRCFYDVNLRSGHWSLDLVERLSSVAQILKLNNHEAEILYELTTKEGNFNLEAFCRHWSYTYKTRIMCITLGSRGCAIFSDDTLRLFDGFLVDVVDTVGCGDAFGAAFLHGLNAGWPIEQCALFANALGAVVATLPGANSEWKIEQCYELMRSRSAYR
ncbi:MAG: carbohydrate kinase [Acidobacteria bacterium]|nr:carbohydrate kinase [Acidobacteriota bacterium]